MYCINIKYCYCCCCLWL